MLLNFKKFIGKKLLKKGIYKILNDLKKSIFSFKDINEIRNELSLIIKGLLNMLLQSDDSNDTLKISKTFASLLVIIEPIALKIEFIDAFCTVISKEYSRLNHYFMEKILSVLFFQEIQSTFF